jgi:hypothetical protein
MSWLLGMDDYSGRMIAEEHYEVMKNILESEKVQKRKQLKQNRNAVPAEMG